MEWIQKAQIEKAVSNLKYQQNYRCPAHSTDIYRSDDSIGKEPHEDRGHRLSLECRASVFPVRSEELVIQTGIPDLQKRKSLTLPS